MQDHQASPESSEGSGGGGQAAAQIVRALGRLRVAIVAQLLASRVGLMLAVIAALSLAAGLLDYFVRFPAELRVLAWLAGAASLAAFLWRSVAPLLRLNLSDTQLALRLEESPLGKAHGWKGVLASGLELAREAERAGGASRAVGHDPALATMAARIASERFGLARSRVLGVLNPRELRRAAGALGLACAVVVGLGAWRSDLLRTGALRVLAPWSGVQWPKRTGVMHAEYPRAHAIGAAFPLRAALTRASGDQRSATVGVQYRAIIDGAAQPMQRALLTPQDKRVRVDAMPGQVASGAMPEGALFERLLDTAALLPSNTQAWSGKDVRLEYAFVTSDDRTQWWRVALVEPPAIASIRVEVTPPSYVARLRASVPDIAMGEIDGGAGLDGRSQVGPILRGSSVGVRVALTRPVPGPGSEAHLEDGGGDAGEAAVGGSVGEPVDAMGAWLARVAPGLAGVPGLKAEAGEDRWSFDFSPEVTLRSPLRVRDAFGIAARDEAQITLDVVEDREPAAVVVEPAQDESVLATAVVGGAGEARDDVAVWSVALRTQVAKARGDSPGAGAEAVGEAAVASIARAREADAPEDASATVARVMRTDATLDLGQMDLSPGDEVLLTTLAIDARDALGDGPAREPTVSRPRRLRIISESELVEQVRAELSGLREGVQRLEQDQRGLSGERSEAAREPAAASRQSPRQGAIAQRLRPIAQTLERLASRVDRNRLNDEALGAILRDAQDAAKAAGEASARASEQLQEISRRPEGATEAQERELAASQEASEEELSQLAQMLGEGQDDWAVRRTLEQLLTEQRQVRAQTAAAGAQTQGKDQNELTQAQREDLERLAKRQQDLAQRAGEALDKLEARAAQVQEQSPSQSRAMQRAVSRARQNQLTQSQQQASEQLRQNQSGQAQQSQQRAERAIEQALEDLEEAQQARDDELRRALADVIRTLDLLIEQQRGELARLAPAMEGGPATGLDVGMGNLHQNTLGALAFIRKEAKEAEQLASLVQAAGEAQSAAIVALRERPAEYAQADEMERVSLSRLEDAKREAERLAEAAQRRNEDRERRQLRKAYAEALELQLALLSDTRALQAQGGRVAPRARRLGERQEAIRVSLEELRTSTKELRDAKAFEFAHRRLERAMSGASGALAEGSVSDASVRDVQTGASVLRSLVEALKERKREDGLQDASAGGGGGGGGAPQGLLPAAAELMLLRGMQDEALQRTRAIADAGDVGRSGVDDVGEVSRLQRELHEQAQDLVRRMQQQGGAGQPGAGGAGDADQGPPPPEGDMDDMDDMDDAGGDGAGDGKDGGS